MGASYFFSFSIMRRFLRVSYSIYYQVKRERQGLFSRFAQFQKNFASKNCPIFQSCNVKEIFDCVGVLQSKGNIVKLANFFQGGAVEAVVFCFHDENISEKKSNVKSFFSF